MLLSAAFNGCLSEVEELVQFATWPAAYDRLAAVTEFLAALDKAEEALEEALTAPLVSPLEANAGHELAGFVRASG